MSDDEGDLLAAELALGLLDPVERREAEARLAREPAFAAAHRRWLDLAARWLDASESDPPPPVWEKIHAALPANDAVADARSARRWRAAALAASAAALVLGVVAVRWRPAPQSATIVAPRPRPPLVALLTGARGGAVAVWVDRTGGRLITAPAALDPGDRSAELWVIPADGIPRALGLLAVRASEGALPPDKAALLLPGATIAVSLEPRGGSSTGRPTGPVVLTGVLAAS